MPSTLFEDTAPSAFLGHLKAQAAPTHPRAPPEQLGGSPWPQQPASGRPKVEESPLSSTRYGEQPYDGARGYADHYDGARSYGEQVEYDYDEPGQVQPPCVHLRCPASHSLAALLGRSTPGSMETQRGTTGSRSMMMTTTTTSDTSRARAADRGNCAGHDTQRASEVVCAGPVERVWCSGLIKLSKGSEVYAHG